MPVVDIKVVHLNGNYERKEVLDVNQLLKLSSSVYNTRNGSSQKLLKTISRDPFDVDKQLRQIRELKEIPQAKKRTACTQRKKCEFYGKCFPEITDEGKLLEMGGSRLDYARHRATQKKGLHMDCMGTKGWLETIRYPITFLDFEWETYAIPPYVGMKPYSILPFQYSIHILHEDGKLEHFEFLGVGDCRKALVKRLIHDVPENGSVMAFNAKAAENRRVLEMEVQFPEYRKELLSISNRMSDLAELFVQGMVYDVEMKNSYSLKTLMGIMDAEAYQSLEIAQGMDAVFEWRKLDDASNLEKTEEIQQKLLNYCGMDSYAMVVIFQWIKEKLKNEVKPFKNK
ncbi:MAG: DUF2779 domain-containing protein [Anaerorhabdus sp.]